MNQKIVITLIVAMILVAVASAYVLTNNQEDPAPDLADNGVYMNVFGNANGDNMVNESDVDAIQSYLNGDTPKDDLIVVTDKNGKSRYLADANADGVVDSSDIDMVKKMADRTQPEYFIQDEADNFMSIVNDPQRVVCEFTQNCEIMQLLGMQDRIVGVSTICLTLGDYYLQGVEDLRNVADLGHHRSPNYEVAAEKNPQVWLTYGDAFEEKSKNTQASVVELKLSSVDLENVYESGVVGGTLLAGYIFNNMDAAMKYIDWVIDLWTNLKTISDGIAEADRPVVFYTGYENYIIDQNDKTLRCFPHTDVLFQAVELAGGHNLTDGVSDLIINGANSRVDLEWVVDQEYDYVFVHTMKFFPNGVGLEGVPMNGYTTNDRTEWESAQDRVAGLSLFDDVPDDHILLTSGDLMNSASGGLLNAVYVGNVIHPDQYNDLDIYDIHQQYIDIMGFDFDVRNNGVFY